MATPVGANVVTSIARRHVIPDVTDNIYRSNPFLFRMIAANKRRVQGGYQIELPFMYARFGNGGPYTGLDVLDITPNDTVKNGAWDWKQYYVPVTFDGLTLIKVDSPLAIADAIRLAFAQADMEMAEHLGTGLMSNGVSNVKHIDGSIGAIDDGTVLPTYAGLSRTANTWLRDQVDTSTTTLSLPPLQSLFGNTTEGGRHPTLIASTQANYNRYWALNASAQRFVYEPAGHDEQLGQAGFSNLVFNGVPWLVDSHIPANHILMYNEDYWYFAVSPRADFYLEDFQTALNQDAMVAKLLWAGNAMCSNPSRQGKMTAVAA